MTKKIECIYIYIDKDDDDDELLLSEKPGDYKDFHTHLSHRKKIYTVVRGICGR